ncbi:MAG TPA: helix-turn-helix domain-containing protein [archaeon]|nr:helix-turn-helix domain-containing protein [archaeon]
MNTEQISSLLEKTGQFDELEIKILSALLQLRKNRRDRFNANQISQAAKISVTNAYKYLYSLQKKGIVESMESEGFGPKRKLFWLSHSSNPFPRLFANYAAEFLEKKQLFSELEGFYSKLSQFNDGVWQGQTVVENFSDDFVERATFVIDAARTEVLVSTPKLFENFVLQDALKRAALRGAIVKIIAAEADISKAKKLQEAGVEIKFGKARPQMIVSDSMHGIDISKSGQWFANKKTDFKKTFLKQWDVAEEI